MSEIDVIEILSTYPDCKTNGRKFKAILTDMYPNASKAIVNTLALMSDCGIVDEILSVKQIDLCEESRWKTKLEDDYGISDKIIWECLSLIIQGIGIAAKDNAGERSVENVGCIEADNPIEKKPKASPLSDFEIENGVLVEYKGRSSVVVIPASVTIIEESAFLDCKKLTTITIPNSVTSIGKYAFEECSSLTSVTIGNGVTSIGDYAFSDCKKLTSITIPNSVTSIGEGAFAGCSGLTSVTIGNGVTSIGDSTFEGCKRLVSITIPESVTSIGYNAFDDTELFNHQPDGLVYIGKVAYRYKGAMPNNVSITIKDGTLEINDCAFLDCKKLTAITIPNSVTSIGNSAFYNCTGLTSITIPKGVISIGGFAFEGCTRLTTVNWNATACTSAGSYDSQIFKNTNLTTVNIGDGVTTIPPYAFDECRELKSITIPNSVTSIGKSAFFCCFGGGRIYYTGDVAGWCRISRLSGDLGPRTLYIDGKKVESELIIPNNVTSIGDFAFYGRKGLTSVTLGNSVTSIGEYAFYGCSGLTSVAIPDSVTSIGEWAFNGCSGLTSVIIGNGVTSIDRYAFNNCDKLTSITYKGTKSQWNTIDKYSNWIARSCKVCCTDGFCRIEPIS